MRQCLGAICRARRSQRSARRSAQDGRRIRQAAKSRGRRTQQVAGRFLCHSQGCILCFPQCERTGWKAKPLASALLEDAGVAIIGGPDFGILGEGYVRVSYANSTENILKALDRMGDFLSNRKAA